MAFEDLQDKYFHNFLYRKLPYFYLKTEVKILWAEDWYDGMLSAYCQLNDKKVFISMIDEERLLEIYFAGKPEFSARRIFLIYELNDKEYTAALAKCQLAQLYFGVGTVIDQSVIIENPNSKPFQEYYLLPETPNPGYDDESKIIGYTY